MRSISASWGLSLTDRFASLSTGLPHNLGGEPQPHFSLSGDFSQDSEYLEQSYPFLLLVLLGSFNFSYIYSVRSREM